MCKHNNIFCYQVKNNTTLTCGEVMISKLWLPIHNSEFESNLDFFSSKYFFASITAALPSSGESVVENTRSGDKYHL